MPPELLRKGRFDEIFFLDLPTAAERQEIFTVHLKKRNRLPQDFDTAQLARQSEGYVGAEIEQAIIDGMYVGFNQGREFTTNDLSHALKRQVPLWDDFLSKILQEKISNDIEKALLANLEWEREAKQSAHVTHRFAFEWVALESGMIRGECAVGNFVRRLGLLAAAPSRADSKIIQNTPPIKAIFDKYRNPHKKIWVKSIEEMYRYRCNILHDGVTEVTSINIDPLKVDWFYHLAKHLNVRLQRLLQSAIDNNLSTLDDMWNKHAINFIYSATDDSWVNPKPLTVNLITFDCSKGRYSEFLNI